MWRRAASARVEEQPAVYRTGRILLDPVGDRDVDVSKVVYLANREAESSRGARLHVDERLSRQAHAFPSVVHDSHFSTAGV